MSEGVRLGAGRFKGKRVAVGPGVRPTGSRVREALFDVLGPRIQGARVLDLFAGSGAVGLEALSRGAAKACLAEADPRVVRVLRRTAAAVAPRSVTVARLHLPRQLSRRRLPTAGPFDLIFADPPYRFEHHAELLRAAAPLLASDGVLVLEHAADEPVPAAAGGLVQTAERRYGESCLSFYEGSTSSPVATDSQPRK